MKKNKANSVAGMKLAYERPETELVTMATECMQTPGGFISESEYDGDGAAKEVVFNDYEKETEETAVEYWQSYSPWED